MPQDLRSDILAFYQDLSLPIATKANESDWARLQEELNHLEAVDRDLSAAELQIVYRVWRGGCQMTDASRLASCVRCWLGYLIVAGGLMPHSHGRLRDAVGR
jgi:hypothetical protein